MIHLTNQDNGKSFLLNKKNIISVEDVGSYRILVYMTNHTSHHKMYALESIEEIKKKLEEEGEYNG